MGLLGDDCVQFSLEFCIILVSLFSRCVDFSLDLVSFFLQFNCLGINSGLVFNKGLIFLSGDFLSCDHSCLKIFCSLILLVNLLGISWVLFVH